MATLLKSALIEQSPQQLLFLFHLQVRSASERFIGSQKVTSHFPVLSSVEVGADFKNKPKCQNSTRLIVFSGAYSTTPRVTVVVAACVDF